MAGENISVETNSLYTKVDLPAHLAGKTEYIIALELDGDAETIPVIKEK
jgi:hypothetical protein